MNLHIFLSIYCQRLRVQHQLSIYSLTLVTFTANCGIALVAGAAAAKLVFCYRMLRGSGSEDLDIDNDGPAVSVRSE